MAGDEKKMGRARKGPGSTSGSTELARVTSEADARAERLTKLTEFALTLTGEPIEVFKKITSMLAETFDLPVVCLSEIRGEELFFLSVYSDGKLVTDADRCDLSITPCATVEDSKDMRVYHQVAEKFPDAAFLKKYNANTYCGFPSLDSSGDVVAVTCLLDDKQRDFSDEDKKLFTLLARRIGLEIERQRVIDEGERAKKDLRLFKNLIDQSNDAILVSDPITGRFTEVNRKALSNLGYTREELLALRVQDIQKIIRNEDIWKEHVRHVKAKGAVMVKGEHRKKDGTYMPVEVSVKYITLDEGEYILAVSRDMTERKIAEDALKASEKKYRTLVDNLPQNIFLKDRDSVYISCNESYAKDLKIGSSEIVGKTDFEFFSKELAEKYKADDMMIIETGKTEDFEEKYVQDGKEITVHTVKTPVKDENGENVAILGIFWDITEEKAAEDALYLERERFYSLLNAMPVMVYLQAPDHTIRFANRNFVEKYGEPGSRPCYEVMWGLSVPCEDCPTFKVFDTEAPEIWESCHEDGATFKVYDYPFTDVDGSPLVLEVSIDITDLKRSEEEREVIQAQLMHAQKMEAIGTLAGGIAHDFNNIMTVVKTLTDLAITRSASDDKIRECLVPVSEASHRAINLVQQLLFFSQKRPISLVELNINDTARELLSMLEHLIGDDIIVKTEFDLGLWNIESDDARIEQLITNLVINASEAMDKGGEVEIETSNRTLSEADCLPGQVDGAYPGNFVSLTVKDSGIGMDGDQKEHIFEPFFTTKETGTGMGLAVVYGIVKEQKGWIEVESGVGRGSTFRVYLPAVLEPGELDAAEDDEVMPEVGASKRILLVEDEKWVRKSTAMVLADYGYKVFEAADAEKALSLFYREKGRFDLVLSDVVMPGRSGLELVGPLLDVNPAIPILLCSSYLDGKAEFEQIMKRGLPFIQKPYEIPELIRAIEETIVQGGR